MCILIGINNPESLALKYEYELQVISVHPLNRVTVYISAHVLLKQYCVAWC